ETRLASHPDGMALWSTSGTSGRPMDTAMSPDEQNYSEALFGRQLGALGLPLTAPIVLAALDHAREQTEMFLSGRSTKVLTPASAATLAEEVRSSRATILLGWPSVLLEVADAL